VGFPRPDRSKLWYADRTHWADLSLEAADRVDEAQNPAGYVAVVAGDAWNFTCWHRDLHVGAPTSNLANGLSIDFVP
jgi:hypothetical protein